jgi:DNA-directed RNA polymerase II subunit RPB3
MNPVVSNLTEEHNYLKFRLSGINVSLANGLRRIVLSEIPTVVFRTTPHAESKANIQINTTRMNNELIKQRLSCIPIHIKETGFPIEDYEVDIDKKNESDTIQYVTTEDFRVKNMKTDTYLTEAATKKIFPPCPLTGFYIDFMRLRPRISDDIGGEQLKMTCKFDTGTSKQDSAFNVAAACSYGATMDPVKVNEEWTKKAKKMKTEKIPDEEIEFAKKDWLLLEAKRYILPDSFDFVVETVGPFSNMSLIHKAADIMLGKLKKFSNAVQTEDGLITKSSVTIPNCFDIRLENEDYTLGKVIEYMLYTKHYDMNSSQSDKSLTYCGFQKPHPHIEVSLIRLGFVDEVDKAAVVVYLVNAVVDAVRVYEKIATDFEKDDE